MLLLKLISPKKLPRRKSEWKFWHKRYKDLLNWLLKKYSYGVINDTIILNEVEVRHTLRDEWFENELNRFGIDFAQKIKATQKLSKRKYHRSNFFSWKETLTVTHSRNRCSLIRDDNVALDSNIEGKLQASIGSDAILVIKLEDKSQSLPKKSKPVDRTGRTSEPEEQPTEETKPSDPTPIKHKGHIKDRESIPETPTSETPVSEQPQDHPTDTFVQHQGFMENDIF